MTTKTCKKCKHKQQLREDRTTTTSWTCSDCGFKNRLLVALLAIIVTLGSLGTVYAEQQDNVVLPFERAFIDKFCGLGTVWYEIIPASTDAKITFSCDWTWDIDDQVAQALPPVPNRESTDYSVWLDEIIPLIEDNPRISQSEPASETGGELETIVEPTVDPLAELDPEVRKAISKLGECQFGIDEWAGIVATYTKEVPDELPIFKSLDRERTLKILAQNYEECRGMTEYSWLSEAYTNRYLADLLGLDYHGRNQTNFGLDDTRNTSGFDVTKEDILEEAQQWQDWMCAEENRHLKLCPDFEFNEIEIGHDAVKGYTDGAECQMEGQPATEGGTKAQERCPLRELEAHQRNAISDERAMWERIYEAQCDEHFKQYEYLAAEDRPEWIQHCNE